MGFGQRIRLHFWKWMLIFTNNPSWLIRLYEAWSVSGYELAVGSPNTYCVNVVNWAHLGEYECLFCECLCKLITGLLSRMTTAWFQVLITKVYSRELNWWGPNFIGYAFQIGNKYRLWSRVKVIWKYLSSFKIEPKNSNNEYWNPSKKRYSGVDLEWKSKVFSAPLINQICWFDGTTLAITIYGIQSIRCS